MHITPTLPHRRRGAIFRRLPALPDRGHLAHRACRGRAHGRLTPHHVDIGVASHQRTLERGNLRHELLQFPVLAHELDPVVSRDNVPACQLLPGLSFGAQPVTVHVYFNREELRDKRTEVVEELEEATDAPLLRRLIEGDSLGGALNCGEVATDWLMREHQALGRPVESLRSLASRVGRLIILSLTLGNARVKRREAPPP